MTDLKFTILDFLYHSPNHEYEETALLNMHLGNLCNASIAVNDMVKENPPLIIRPIGKNTLMLTTYGNVVYETEKEARQQKSDNKSERIFNRKTTVLSLIVAAIALAISVIDFILRFI